MLKWLLTGGLIPAALMGCGLFFLLYLRGRPLLCPVQMLRALSPKRLAGAEGRGRTSPFRAVTLALAGTLGVGNIVGVASAIRIGGPGAILWMWVSALFAMILKYAEILLAVAHRRTGNGGRFFGGAIYYLRDLLQKKRLHRLGAILPTVFALLLLLNSLSMGCVIQVNAVSGALHGIWGFPKWLCGLLLLLLTLPLLAGKGGGGKAVCRVTELLVPVMTLGYVILSVAALIVRREALFEALASIFRDALQPTSGIGGVVGFLTSRALRVGTMRGLLSNEAGCGTAPTAHASADAKSPCAQGVWGIVEVFVDTVLLCTATALVILCSGIPLSQGDGGVMMTVQAYGAILGGSAERFLGGAILCFGWATLLCWGDYGRESLLALRGGRRLYPLYALLFGLCTVAGAIVAPESVWGIADFAIAALTSINLCALLAMRREIRAETEWGFSKASRGRTASNE